MLAAAALFAHMDLCAVAMPQNPLRSDGAIFVSHQGVHRFVPPIPEPQWSSLAGVETFAPVRQGELLLVGSTQGLYALEAESGAIRWHIEKRRTMFSPTAADAIYAGSAHGELYAIDADDGNIRWRRVFGGWIYSPVVDLDAGLLWSGGRSHRLYGVASADGSLRHTLSSSQELVFSPIPIGKGAAAFNLFDGSTLIVATSSGDILASLDGETQPTGLVRKGAFFYRSHRGGLLDGFASDGFAHHSRRDTGMIELTPHPALPGYLLLGNRDRELLLIDLANDAECRIRLDGVAVLPLQTAAGRIAYFRKNLQPPGFTLVQPADKCK